ncbi:MAG: DNA topoisomerase (ATP-hydrolyzing) subunit B [Oscillospiraceae bacterium]|nr:DNA topoisomerase (ATP-hydrolyzing) subunit B [Oscillospiraceae bacterium]
MQKLGQELDVKTSEKPAETLGTPEASENHYADANVGEILDISQSDSKVEGDYGADNIEILEGLSAVRMRPAMYIGTTGPKGLHHLVNEIVDNSIDEALAGYCTEINVAILPDNVIEISDNGRGIPVDIHPKEGISAATIVYTILHAGGKFGGGGYKVSGGLHGVGASVVNALSEWLELTVCNGENIYQQKFTNGGNYEKPLEIVGKTDKTGTKVRFKADATIFQTVEYEYSVIRDRMREQAFLNAGLIFNTSDLRDESLAKQDKFVYDGGIVSYIDWLQKKRGATVLHNDVILLSGMVDNITVEIAFQYNNDFNSETIRSFANNIFTGGGGTHEVAFRRALSKTVNDFVKKHREEEAKKPGKGKKKKGEEEAHTNISGEAIREAINAIISVKLPETEFEGQTKDKLGNPEVGPIVYKIVTEKLTYYFEENPETSNIIVTKAINAQAARDAARKALEAKRKSVTDGVGLPGKLADCYEKDVTKTEIYIVEGDSAGGSAKQGRDSAFQAILPLWGKMLNVERARIDKVLGNDKLTPVVKALGTGIGEEFSLQKLRYGRIVIMADADVDGSHIRTLLLTFFYRFMRPLVESGKIYIAQPPLFKVYRGKKVKYAFNENELDTYIKEFAGENNAKVDVQRYKGLGEMNADQLWETTMNPETRTMKRVEIDDAASADETFSILMGDKVEPRRNFIEQNAKTVANLDV